MVYSRNRARLLDSAPVPVSVYDPSLQRFGWFVAPIKRDRYLVTCELWFGVATLYAIPCQSLHVDVYRRLIITFFRRMKDSSAPRRTLRERNIAFLIEFRYNVFVLCMCACGVSVCVFCVCTYVFWSVNHVPYTRYHYSFKCSFQMNYVFC